MVQELVSPESEVRMLVPITQDVPLAEPLSVGTGPPEGRVLREGL